MKMPNDPKYEWGQRVIAEIHLYNDGSHPDCDAEALLVERGTAGEIIQIGRHVEMDLAVYMVAFPGDRIVGCREDEIAPA